MVKKTLNLLFCRVGVATARIYTVVDKNPSLAGKSSDDAIYVYLSEPTEISAKP